MSDSDMSVVEEETCSLNFLFVKLAVAHPILFEKSHRPDVRKGKKEALEAIQTTLAEILGRQLTNDQILKKFNNLKAHTKKKMLLKKAGNQHVVFSDAQKLLSDFLEENNATLHISLEETTDPQPQTSQKESSTVESSCAVKEKRPFSFKRKHSDPVFDFETEETKKLSNQELQRMALLLQIDYLRSKKARLPTSKNIQIYDANGNLIEMESQPIQIVSFKQK